MAETPNPDTRHCWFTLDTMAGPWTCDLGVEHEGPHRSPLGNLFNDDRTPFRETPNPDTPPTFVKRLRSHAEWLHENQGHRPSGRNPIGEDCADAADQIERLRAEVAALRAANERLRREIEFLEMLADGGDIAVNGVPWREMFARFNAIVSDPVDCGGSGAAGGTDD